MTTDLLRYIKTGRRKPLYTIGETTTRVHLSRNEIERMLPHRDPFLFVDHISAVDLSERTAIGHRAINLEDPVLTGHFPDYPVYPGVLLIETIGQAALCLLHLSSKDRVEVHRDDKPQSVRLVKLHHTVFMAEVRPGDELTIIVRAIEEGPYTTVVVGQILRGESPCVVSAMEAYLMNS